MISIGEQLKNKYIRTGGKTPHETWAITNLIKDAGLFQEPYGRFYWLKMVAESKISYNEMLGIIKDVFRMNKKYNKGGYLTNVLIQKRKRLARSNYLANQQNHDNKKN